MFPPFQSRACPSLCTWFLSWFIQWHMPPPYSLGHASCPSRGYLAWYCFSPVLLHCILPEQGSQLMLIHLTTDRLCQWHPADSTLRSLSCKYCIVDRATLELREHFGTCEHSYGHWIDLDMPHGRFPLWQLLRERPAVAHPQCRDIALLRLVSWLSCEVPSMVQQVLNQLMILFGDVTPAPFCEVIAIGLQQLGVVASGEPTWDMVRDALIRGVTIGGQTCPTEEVGRLMVSFLQRLPLPRLVHFLDMILPQMVPVQSPCHSRRRRFASSYRVEERLAGGDLVVEYPLQVCKLFWSRSGVMRVPIAWDSKPLLLLTTLLPNRSTDSFQWEAGPPYDKQKIQMGLRKGNTALVYFSSGVVHYQCVLIMLASDLSSSKPKHGQHKYWRYVSPLRTYFAWLPETLARTYCREALDMQSRIPNGEVHHLQGEAYDVHHSLVFQNIYHIGDTKSAKELEVFLRMPRERLRLCCVIQCTDSMHPQNLLGLCLFGCAAQGSAKNCLLRHWSCCGLQLELRLSVVRTLNKVHCKRPSCHSSGWMMDMYWLLWAQLFWLCVKDVLAWPLAECLEQAKLAQLLPCWLGYWSSTRACN